MAGRIDMDEDEECSIHHPLLFDVIQGERGEYVFPHHYFQKECQTSVRVNHANLIRPSAVHPKSSSSAKRPALFSSSASLILRRE